MLSVLRKLELGTLIDSFKAERIDVDAILSATDGELIRLGVDTIGDRIRIRDLCKKEKLETTSGSTSSSSLAPGSSRQERLALFNPRNPRNKTDQSSKRGDSKRNTAKSKSWTGQFVCLADRFCRKTPTSTEKEILFGAGLGLKKIKLHVDDDEENVLDKITSDVIGEDGRPLGFPALKSCGGFEMMRCTANCRDLTPMRCGWSTRDIRANLGGGQGKIYLVPIQKCISTKAREKKGSKSALKERCNSCKKEFPIQDLRKHVWECSVMSSDDNLSDDEMMKSTFKDGASEPPEETESQLNSGSVIAVSPSQAVNATSFPSSSSSSSINESNIHASTSAVNTNTVDLTRESPGATTGNYESTVNKVADEVVQFCQEKDISDPVEILRCLQKHMVTGRQLEIENISEANEGATNYILVDRSNILQTAFDEISSLEDLRKTLEVNFYNEVSFVSTALV